MNAKTRFRWVWRWWRVGAVAFMPASADDRDERGHFAAGNIVALAPVANGNARDEVWDMTYGATVPGHRRGDDGRGGG